jgi:hypothetical protein
LLVDIPRALFTPLPQIVRLISHQEPRGGDRAEALERAFEHLWRTIPPSAKQPATRIDFARPFLSLFYADDKGKQIRAGMPVWIANGTDLATGSRLITVPFRPDGNWPFPAAVDALSALGADVRISTAINDTARFSYLEPAGELLAYEPPNQEKLPTLDERRQPNGSAREIIDGGYFENEGLQTALDLANWLQQPGLLANRTVEPIIVQATGDGEVLPIETVVRCEPRKDDPSAITTTRRPLQLLAPPLGLYNVRGGHSAVLLREARTEFCAEDKRQFNQCDVLPVRCLAPQPATQRFFHFYLPGDGDKSLPLNWILSDSTARFIWNDAMQQGGNLREAWIMQQALKPSQ